MKAIKKTLGLLSYINMILGMILISGMICFVILYPIIDMLVYKGIL